MANNLYNMLGNNVPMGNQTMNKFAQFVSQFKQMSNCSPQERVQQLLNSGQMSQEQFNQFAQIANRLTGRK